MYRFRGRPAAQKANAARFLPIMLMCAACMSTLVFAENPSVSPAPSSKQDKIIYVNRAATGANDGTSWENAYAHLEDALAAAQYGGEIWVAAGVYNPPPAADPRPAYPYSPFSATNGVRVYGGFKGDEQTRESRNPDPFTNNTILSGDINGDDNDNLSLDEPTRQDNADNILTFDKCDFSTAFDGFTITCGNSAGVWVIESRALLRNLRISHNLSDYQFGSGGGMFCKEIYCPIDLPEEGTMWDDYYGDDS